MAADQATYNFLLVLDGLLAFEGGGEKGQLQLMYDDGKKRLSLSGHDTQELSGIYKEEEN
jgi:hypothetical protein